METMDANDKGNYAGRTFRLTAMGRASNCFSVVVMFAVSMGATSASRCIAGKLIDVIGLSNVSAYNALGEYLPDEETSDVVVQVETGLSASDCVE